jgi:hypothetical protein
LRRAAPVGGGAVRPGWAVVLRVVGGFLGRGAV